MNENQIRKRNRGYSKKYYEINSENELFKLKKSLKNKIQYERRKKIKSQSFAADDGYNTRDALRKATQKVEAHMPKKKLQAALVAQQLARKHPVEMEDQTTCAKRSKELNAEERQVLEFYESERNVVILPGKRDYVVRRNSQGEKIKLQKHVLKESKDNSFKNFQAQYPENSIKRTKFCKLSPKNVISFRQMPQWSCLCEDHENFKFLFQAVKSHLKISTDDHHEFLNHFTCDDENFACMNSECSNCKDVEGKFKKIIKNTRGKIALKQWKKEQNFNKPIEIQLRLKEIVEKYSSDISAFKIHSITEKIQNSKKDDDLKKLSQDTALLMMDFSENEVLIPQSEVQKAFYSRTNATLFTAMLYVVDEDGELKKIKIGIISNSLNHDKAATNSFMRKILKFVKLEFPRIKHVIIWSDGAPAHFKNRYTITNLITLQNEFRLRMTWNFFATSHGKSPCDGIGASIKRMFNDRVKSQNLNVSSAECFYNHAKRICEGFKIFFVSQEEIEEQSKIFQEQCDRCKAITGVRSQHKFEVVDSQHIRSFQTSYDQNQKCHKVF